MSKNSSSRKAKKRILRGLPPLPEPVKIKWTCPICGSDKNKSRHHIEPDRLRKNHNKNNLDTICRECHNDVERCYDVIISGIFPILWKEARRASTVERAYVYLHQEFLESPEKVSPERWKETNLPPDITLDKLEEIIKEAALITYNAKHALYESCLTLNWNLIYNCVKLTLAVKSCSFEEVREKSLNLKVNLLGEEDVFL
jgi:hypothetical protein